MASSSGTQKLDEKLNSALNLMRRMPPSSTENSLAGLLELAPDLTDELLTHVDQPLQVKTDEQEKKDFVMCDYNRDGDSYRSPWTNQYFPPMTDGFKPNEPLRKLEVYANKMFDIYRKLYFGGGNSSAYFFETSDDTDKGGFGACFLISKSVAKDKDGKKQTQSVAKDKDAKKKGDKKDTKAVLKKGIWDSIHVFEVIPKGGKSFTYKLTTTVMISLLLQKDETIGLADLSGLRTQQHESSNTITIPTDHIKNMGQMLEDCETRIRNEIESIYIDKTRTVVNGMRGGNQQLQKQWGDIAASLKNAQFHNKS